MFSIEVCKVEVITSGLAFEDFKYCELTEEYYLEIGDDTYYSGIRFESELNHCLNHDLAAYLIKGDPVSHSLVFKEKSHTCETSSIIPVHVLSSDNNGCLGVYATEEAANGMLNEIYKGGFFGHIEVEEEELDLSGIKLNKVK